MSEKTMGPRQSRPGILTPAQERVAQAIARLGPEISLTDISRMVGGHPNASRQHIKTLENSGYISATQKRGAAGRPAQLYSITPEGLRALAGNATLIAHTSFVRSLSHYIANQPHPEERALALGSQMVRDEGPLPGATKVDKVVNLLEKYGFAPTQAGTEIQLLTCPVLDSAVRHPEVVCTMHRGILNEITVNNTTFILEPFARPGMCVIRTVSPTANPTQT